jgi:hypothetical protein
MIFFFIAIRAVEQKNLQDIQRTQEILLQIPKLKDTFQFQNDTSRIITNDTKCSNTSSSDTTSSYVKKNILIYYDKTLIHFFF